MPNKKTKTAEKFPGKKQKADHAEKTEWVFSEAILLALASSGAYFLAFRYEKSYADYFGIPVDLITISLNSVLLFFAILSGLLLLLFYILDILIVIFGKTNSVMLQAIFPILIIFVLLVIQIYFYGIGEWEKWILFLSLILGVAFLQLGLPLITQRQESSYLDKLKAQAEYDNNKTNFTNLLAKLFGINGLVVLLIFTFGLLIANSAGNSEAIRKGEFLIANTKPEVVVLRVYNELAIAAQFNRNTGEVSKNFSLISIKDNPQIIFSMENLGPLHKSR